MSKPIDLYQDKNDFSQVIKLVWLGSLSLSLLSYIDSICFVKWPGLVMLSQLSQFGYISQVMLGW